MHHLNFMEWTKFAVEKLMVIVLVNCCCLQLSAQNKLPATAILQGKASNNLQAVFSQFPTNQAISFTIVAPAIASKAKNWQEHFGCGIRQLSPEINAVVIHCTPKTLQQLLVLDSSILFVDQYQQAQTEVLVQSQNKTLHGLNAADFYWPTANGKNTVVGIKEKDMDASDIDLKNRIRNSTIKDNSKDDHATTIGSLVAGAGNSFVLGKGLASQAQLFPSSFANLFADETALLNNAGVTVQNHSYGTIIQSFYGAEALSYDQQCRNQPSLLHVFSAGNRGNGLSTQGSFANIAGFANLTGNFKMAKNVICVAALDTTGNQAFFSSVGPTYDGRLQPQITALGPDGTSDAAALVSGAALVLQQIYKDSNSQSLPTAALIQSILFNSADDIGTKGIDYKTGYGALNLPKAIRQLQTRQYDGGALAQNETWTKTLAVPANAANFKITLCWTDTAAAINAAKALVNDLDLSLVQNSNAQPFYPSILSTAANADSLKKMAIRGRDTLNTVEQISIDLPQSGSYTLAVRGSKIATTAKQNFHVSYSWETLNNFQFISPLRESDVNAKRSNGINIKWSVALADTLQTGNLFYSLNNGQTWAAIASGIRLNQQQFNWTAGGITGIAQLRMQTNFGNFISGAFSIAPLTKLAVNFVCGDSIGFSWNKHPNANTYQIFQAIDSPYLKKLITVNDTSFVLRTSGGATNVLAVQPLLANNLEATRSVAINLATQGVNCYYSEFFAELIGNAVQLNLSLPATALVDSVVFEKLTTNNQWQKRIGGAIVQQNLLSYSATDAEPANGANYYRAKLHLKNSRIVYSSTISIISNGSKNIFLYPNPVASAGRLNFQLKDNAIDNTLQLMDANGKIVWQKLIGLSGFVDMSKLPIGIYWFRLLDASGNLAESGKIIYLK
jgi:hypothetical protein